ncbi:MAG: hypothetical protein NC489_28565 [Ruminococcus flavefaciens]|nr:hypothetical protein [Ruminococcus flavefaciens]
MANYSQYKNLELPVTPEYYDVNVFNKNAMVIDSELNKLDLKNKSQDELLATKESLEAETLRATNKEITITGDLTSEVSRAKSSENELSERIVTEINRASMVENIMSENFSTLISELTERLNALADSDDTTLDQLSEIVAYIKNNKNIIDEITTSKINTTDIVDNLLSTTINKPLSSNQGRILKEMIDNLSFESIGASAANHSHGDIKTITISAIEPEIVAEGEIVIVYES